MAAKKPDLRSVDGGAWEPGSESPVGQPQPIDGERTERFLQPIHINVPGMPVTHLFAPPGYLVGADGVVRIQERINKETGEKTPVEVRVCSAPVILTARYVDVDTKQEHLRLDWKWPDQGWRHSIEERRTIIETRRIYDLGSKGFPVASDNAGEVIRYLRAFEDANRTQIPTSSVSTHLGWQGRRGDQGFLIGSTHVWSAELVAGVPEGGTKVVTAPSDENDLEPAILFRGADAGDDDIARGYRTKGEFYGWTSAMRALKNFPRAQVAVAASFVPPLMEICGIPNFTVSFAGSTSVGKSTVQRAAASVWGDPDAKSTEGTVIKSWDATRVWIERACTVSSGLPMLLDDTNKAKKLEDIPHILYSIENGQGKGRGTIRGLGAVGRFRTVLISNGEAPLTSLTKAGGARARCVEFIGSPFGSSSPATREAVNKINIDCMKHYGHAGQRFIAHLIANQEDWDAYRIDYEGRRDKIAAESTNDVEARMGAYVAALDFASYLVNMLFELGWDTKAMVAEVKASVAAQASDAAPYLRAIRYVASWVHQHQQRFYGRHRMQQMPDREHEGDEVAAFSIKSTVENLQPSGGWAGRWDDNDNAEFVGFLPNVLDEVLEQGGFSDRGTILDEWEQRDWLILDGEKKSPKTRMGRGKTAPAPRMVQIKTQFLLT